MLKENLSIETTLTFKKGQQVYNPISITEICSVRRFGGFIVFNKVAGPDHFDPNPDPAFHFDTDPPPTFHFYTDPDPTFLFDTDPDPC
jgi:hypothetical protein